MSPRGVVKWFSPALGVGLIGKEGAGDDVTAESSAIHGEDRILCRGEEVHFDLTLDSSGLRADNIYRSDDARHHHGPCPHTRYQHPPEVI
ncbi:cold shock domain-containing protein [Streptomyces sp. NPDC087219]|uniref:cold shock domain-containing protein n=1 Tax=Streptomyces sp. NPDC087219 TaxID=3365770 RepID=UPI0037F5BD11